MRSGEDEARSPKYAHIERERRWRVDPANRPDLTERPYTLIEDRYITNTRLRLRRMTDSNSGETAHKLTKKYLCDDPLARPIVTSYLSEQEYALLTTLPAFPLTKKRYQVDVDGIIWSLDCFAGALAGLELAEIEWPDDAGLRQLMPPAWATEEVSENPLYQGGALAEFGLAEKQIWRILE
ncbi:MAG: hypothetical protein AAFX04_13710 [Pseudomonadota bacterium]